MKQLSGQDAMFLYWESEGAAMHTAMLSVYDPSTAPKGKVGFETVRAHVKRCLPISDVFRQKLAPVAFNLDHPYWIRDQDFDLDRHLRRVTLTTPTWEAYCQLVADLHGQPLDRSRPLWEMIYIDGLDGVRDYPKGSFALMTKIHHAAIDGATGAAITAGLHDLKADAPVKFITDRFVGEPTPSVSGLLLRSVRNNLRAPARIAGPLRRMLPGLARSLKPAPDSNAAAQRRGPMTRFNGRVSARRIYDAREYALKDLSAIRKAVPGATVNDVILAIASGGIRNYLEAKNELPEQSLIAMVPVNTRSEGGATDGNQVSLMMLPLCTHVADPLDRLRAITGNTARAKETANAVGARELTELNQAAPAATMALSFRLVTAANLLGKLRAFNTVVSNVPGPQVPIYLRGARMLSWSGLGPCSHGLGFGFPVLSYNGKVNFAFNGCGEAVPDVDFAGACLDRAFESLRNAALDACAETLK